MNRLSVIVGIFMVAVTVNLAVALNEYKNVNQCNMPVKAVDTVKKTT